MCWREYVVARAGRWRLKARGQSHTKTRVKAGRTGPRACHARSALRAGPADGSNSVYFTIFDLCAWTDAGTRLYNVRFRAYLGSIRVCGAPQSFRGTREFSGNAIPRARTLFSRAHSTFRGDNKPPLKQTYLPFATSHMRALQSYDPDTTSLPSGEKATECTQLVCFFRGPCTTWPV